ncbi:MAG: class I SAM-dependent methyltransferase, partial [Candidatus Pacearchaeota archaeon]
MTKGREEKMILENIAKISLLDKSRRMGHDICQFHQSQLSEPDYMSMVSKTVDKVMEELPKEKTTDILEIGAGSGIFSGRLIEKLAGSNGRFNLNITEPDPDLINFCREYIIAKKYNLSRDQKVQFLQLKAEDADRLKREYDAIVSTEVFHHIPYEDKLTSSKRLLHHLSKSGKM